MRRLLGISRALSKLETRRARGEVAVKGAVGNRPPLLVVCTSPGILNLMDVLTSAKRYGLSCGAYLVDWISQSFRSTYLKRWVRNSRHASGALQSLVLGSPTSASILVSSGILDSEQVLGVLNRIM
jgi:hypothetical protein